MNFGQKIKSFKFVTKMTNFPKWLITLPLVKEPLIYSMAGKIESSSTLYLYSSVEIFKKMSHVRNQNHAKINLELFCYTWPNKCVYFRLDQIK